MGPQGFWEVPGRTEFCTFQAFEVLTFFFFNPGVLYNFVDKKQQIPQQPGHAQMQRGGQESGRASPTVQTSRWAGQVPGRSPLGFPAAYPNLLG